MVDAGARHAGGQRQCLGDADAQGALPAHVVDRLVAAGEPVDDPHDDPEDDQHDGDLVGLAEPGDDEVLEGDADDPGRDGTDEQQPGQALVGGLDAPSRQSCGRSRREGDPGRASSR